MKIIKGKNLNSNQRAQVLSAFIYRFTGDHVPSWAKGTMPNGDTYKPQFPTDNDWINAYAFYFKDDGTLASKPGHCVPVEWAEDEQMRKDLIKYPLSS